VISQDTPEARGLVMVCWFDSQMKTSLGSVEDMKLSSTGVLVLNQNFADTKI
jgi:hypothetical protein